MEDASYFKQTFRLPNSKSADPTIYYETLNKPDSSNVYIFSTVVQLKHLNKTEENLKKTSMLLSVFSVVSGKNSLGLKGKAIRVSLKAISPDERCWLDKRNGKDTSLALAGSPGASAVCAYMCFL